MCYIFILFIEVSVFCSLWLIYVSDTHSPSDLVGKSVCVCEGFDSLAQEEVEEVVLWSPVEE